MLLHFWRDVYGMPILPCLEVVSTVFGLYRHTPWHNYAFKAFSTDGNRSGESNLASICQGAPCSSSSSDRSSNSALEKSVKKRFPDKKNIFDARSMLSLARFLANIRSHFDKLRSKAHVVVCTVKCLVALDAKFARLCRIRLQDASTAY